MGMDHVSTGSDSFQNWRTPRLLGTNLVEEYELEVDGAADEYNSLCPLFFDEETDGLAQEWPVRMWINNPYRHTKRWLKKAYEEVDANRCPLAIFLVPAAIGVSWWTEAYNRCGIWLFDERIEFEVPPYESLPEDLRRKLYTHDKTTGEVVLRKDGNPKPKTQPGGGSCLIEVRVGGPTGVLGMRDSITGEILYRQ